MRTRMYGGVRGRKTKAGRKLSFSSYSIALRRREGIAHLLRKYGRQKETNKILNREQISASFTDMEL